MDTSAEFSKPKKSWWRSALRIAACFLAVWLISQEVIAFMPWYFARQMGRDYPRLSMVPHALNLFDRQDRNFKLWLTARKDAKTPVMTQAEVNAIVRSLHGTRDTDKPVSTHPEVSEVRY